MQPDCARPPIFRVLPLWPAHRLPVCEHGSMALLGLLRQPRHHPDRKGQSALEPSHGTASRLPRRPKAVPRWPPQVAGSQRSPASGHGARAEAILVGLATIVGAIAAILALYPS